MKNLERVEPQFQITSSGVQWFDLGVVFASSGGETFSPADIQRLILSGQSHTRLKNGKMAVIDTGAVEELQEVLLDCAPQQHAQGYRITSQQAGFLEATLRQHTDWRVQAPAAWRERAARQSGDAEAGMPAARRPGDGAAAVPEAGRGVAALPARERVRRHSRRRNGFGQDAADAGVPAFRCGRRRPARRPASLDRLPDEPRVQLGGRGQEVHAGAEGPGAARAGPARALRADSRRTTSS